MSGHQEYKCPKCGCEWESLEAPDCPRCRELPSSTGSVTVHTPTADETKQNKIDEAWQVVLVIGEQYSKARKLCIQQEDAARLARSKLQEAVEYAHRSEFGHYP